MVGGIEIEDVGNVLHCHIFSLILLLQETWPFFWPGRGRRKLFIHWVTMVEVVLGVYEILAFSHTGSRVSVL